MLVRGGALGGGGQGVTSLLWGLAPAIGGTTSGGGEVPVPHIQMEPQVSCIHNRIYTAHQAIQNRKIRSIESLLVGRTHA